MNSNEKKGNMRRRVAAATGQAYLKGNHPNSIEANADKETRKKISRGRYLLEQDQKAMEYWFRSDCLVHA